MPELVIVSVIGLVVFSPAKFPDFGKTLAAAIRGLRKTINIIDECTFERSGSLIPSNQGCRL